MKNICIYDLASSYKVKVVDFESKDEKIDFYLPPSLIKRDKVHKNFKCSLFNPQNPDFSSFATMTDFLLFSYDNDSLLTLAEIMCSMCWDNSPEWQLIEEYFKAVRKSVSAELKKENLKVEKTVILVPDALPIESQAKLLSYFPRSSTSLLWHSIAIALGNENILNSVLDKNCVAIVDEFGCLGLFASKIEIKKEDGRPIPCHKIYKTADGKISNYYKKNQESKLKAVLNGEVQVDRLSASYRQLKMERRLASLPFKRTVLKGDNVFSFDIQNASSIIATSNAIVRSFAPIAKVDVETSGFNGVVKFVEYINSGLIPYYDECESFSIISQNKKEEIEYFVLIEKNAYLPGGKITKGKKIESLSIPKGSKEANFYFHLGNIENDYAQLRKYTQNFPIEGNLDENRPLILFPSVIPGQGYPQIVIEDKCNEKLFPPIELDWKNIELAIEEGKIVTKAYLENHLERSFPPDVPPVVSRFAENGPSFTIAHDLLRLVKNPFGSDMFYNQSKWPYINDTKHGVNRFARENIFGSYSPKYGHDKSFPLVPEISKQDYVNVFKYYAENYNKTGDPDMVRNLAWSYLRYDLNGAMIKEIKESTNRVITFLENKSNLAIPPAYASYLANMIVTEDEFERVIVLFDKVLKEKGGGINNWCRAMYQVLMYTPFIYSEKNTRINDATISCMRNLVQYLQGCFDKKSPSLTVADNILRVMLYLLKRRVFDKTYCKKNSKDGLYDDVLNTLEAVEDYMLFRDSNSYVLITVKSIIDYLNGKGNLNGIPAPIAD